MSTRRPPRNDYAELTARFAVVRRAWKRSAALSGLAVVATEGVGVFTALLFIDWLYQPLPMVRIGLWTVALAGIGFLLARHVFKPLARKIPDEQIALFIEEHRSELDGMLITAVEFSRKRESVPDSQATLIDAVVREAAAKSGRASVGRMGDASRLLKYGVGLLVAAGIYVLLSVLFPATFGHHVGRVLEPWQSTPEDVARHQAALEQAAPLRFSLSRGNTSLPRGTSFSFEVTLSKAKPPEAAVELFLRPRSAGAKWEKLPMAEIEKLNTYQGTIPDVSEDLEFYISCGATRSATYRLTAFDPLVVQSMEMTVHPPAYVKQPDEVVRPFTGDLTALVGSTATLRIRTSTPLKEGQIKWASGTVQPMTIDAQSKSTAVFTFEIKEDATFDYRLVDSNAQEANSAAPLSVHAIPDAPPTIKIISPQSPVLTQPLGEIDFQAEAGDDFGVAGVDLVYSLEDAQGQAHETRIPLTLAPLDDKQTPHAVGAAYQLMLESANPPFQPDDAISYHLEARDAKGQVTSSEIGFIIVGYFEHWSTWGGKEAFSLHHAGPDLMSILNLTWQLDSKKPTLAHADFLKQSQDIAGQLVGPDGAPVDFLHLSKFPQLARVKDVVNAHIKNAHAALLAGETSTAISDLSVAVALVAGGQLKQDSVSHLDDQVVVGGKSSAPAYAMLELTRAKALEAAAKGKTHAEGSEAAAKAAAELAKKVEALRQAEAGMIAQAQGKNPAAGANSKGEGGKGDSKLAASQHDLAGKARAAGQEAKAQGAGAGGKVEAAANKATEAAGLMEEAARAFAAGKNSDGQAKAILAKSTLSEALETLKTSDRDKLAALISNAARHASLILEKQQDLSGNTAASATELGTNKPDQRQQRDLQAQAYRQTVLGADAEVLASEIGDLNQLAAQVGQPETVRELTEAQRVIKRTAPNSKMSDAVIDLNNAAPGTAAGEQRDAETALQKIVDHLGAAADALADNRESQLSRANRAAQETQQSLAMLGKPAGQAAASPDGTSDDHVSQAAYDLSQLSAVIDNRQIVAQNDSDQLKQMTTDKSQLEKRLATDAKFQSDLSALVSTIAEKIQAELRAKAEAGKLYSSQREECPPEYRQFVNKYFEDLSRDLPAPAPAGQP